MIIHNIFVETDKLFFCFFDEQKKMKIEINLEIVIFVT